MTKQVTLSCAIAWLLIAAAAPLRAAGGHPAAAPQEAFVYRPEDAARAFEGAAHATVRFRRDRVITAVVADTPERSMYGYMFHREVKEDEGMLFVYPESGSHPFWMKNTLVPLDIVWMDEAFNILYIEAPAKPCQADPCPSYGTPRLSRYVLELRAGTARQEALKPGDRLSVSLPGDGASPARAGVAQ
jgi:uncharacterized membrane protein (UPF0127 family)